VDEGRPDIGAAEPAIKFDLDAVRHNGLSQMVEHERETSLLLASSATRLIEEPVCG
jgi:hypothetical protein